MPFVFKHRRPPESWHETKRKAPHRYLRPFTFANWLGEWAAYFLGKWSVFEILEYLGSFSILIAVIFYFSDSGDRLKQKHYQAWQVINTAQGKGGSGGRIEALQELNEDHVPLVGVDVSDAYLQDVKLIHADLRRSDLRATDLRHAVLRESNLEGVNLRSANLREADLHSINLTDASLADADLNGATLEAASVRNADLSNADLRGVDLKNLRDWQTIKSIRTANIHGVRNAPPGFAAWAEKMEAVDLEKDADWEALASKPASHPTLTPGR